MGHVSINKNKNKANTILRNCIYSLAHNYTQYRMRNSMLLNRKYAMFIHTCNLTVLYMCTHNNLYRVCSAPMKTSFNFVGLNATNK